MGSPITPYQLGTQMGLFTADELGGILADLGGVAVAAGAVVGTGMLRRLRVDTRGERIGSASEMYVLKVPRAFADAAPIGGTVTADGEEYVIRGYDYDARDHSLYENLVLEKA